MIAYFFEPFRQHLYGSERNRSADIPGNGALLDGVDQFMGGNGRIEAASAEIDIAAPRVRPGTHRFVPADAVRTHMKIDRRKIGSKAVPHFSADRIWGSVSNPRRKAFSFRFCCGNLRIHHLPHNTVGGSGRRKRYRHGHHETVGQSKIWLILLIFTLRLELFFLLRSLFQIFILICHYSRPANQYKRLYYHHINCITYFFRWYQLSKAL